MPAVQLTISQPCHERWDAMTPAGAGRHCAACQQVVVDFTQKTDADILAHLARATSGQNCGRFRPDQLARPLLPAESPRRWRSWLASVLALGGVLGSGRAAAQVGGNYFGPGPTPTVASPAASGSAPAPGLQAVPAPASVAASVPNLPGGPQVLRGIVLDAASGERLPGVTVLLKGTTLGTSTDVKGEFALEVSTAASATLQLSSVGYTSEEIPAASAASATPATIKLAASVLGEMGIVVIGGYGRKPWPWHPRALYQRTKYLVTQPFRQ